jgi:putative Mg2+ transporter-C (MgtC) family protein
LYENVVTEPILRLLIAVLIGGLIGLDRAYRGRAAGFRTHILVCLASALLMLLMDFQWEMIPSKHAESVRVDPTRMAQGIMTGIGFLGAGVIMQDKMIVRGLTTAASIWITSAIGIVVGAGFYLAAAWCTVLVLVTLTVFNRMIDMMPTRQYARLTVSFNRDESLSPNQVESMVREYQATVSSFSHKLESEGKVIAYQMIIHTKETSNFSAIARHFLALQQVRGFHLWPLGE